MNDILRVIAVHLNWLSPHVPRLPLMTLAALEEALGEGSLHAISIGSGMRPGDPHGITNLRFTSVIIEIHTHRLLLWVLRLTLRDRPEHPYAPVLRRLEMMEAARRLNGGELILDDIRAALDRVRLDQTA